MDDALNCETGLTGEFSPMRSNTQQVQSSISAARQQSLRRLPSGGASPPARIEPIQSLRSLESRGPKAPYGKGIEKPEVSIVRNYRPMSTMAGTVAPPPPRQRRAV